MTSSEDYETKAQLMLNKPQNYGLDEFPDVIIEVWMVDDSLASELKEVYIEEMERRSKDPTKEYELIA